MIYSSQGDYSDDDQDLANYRIGVRRRVKLSEQMTFALKVVVVATNRKLLEMLQANRIDVAIISKVNFMVESANHNFSDLIQADVDFERIPLYHYLHEKNSELVPRLTEMLKQVSLEGELDNLIDKAISDTSYQHSVK